MADLVEGPNFRVALETAFVALSAVQEIPSLEELKDEVRFRKSLQELKLSPNEIEERVQQSSEAKVNRRRLTREERFEITDVIDRHQRILLLGDPGTGKSTLLHYLVLTIARWGNSSARARFPVYLRLTDYDRDAEGLGIRDYLYAEKESPARLSRTLMDDQIEKGLCLFLLDGLDEVLDIGRRRSIVERIKELADGLGRGGQIIVTSRVVGYLNASLPAGKNGFVHYRIKPMDGQQMERFAACWLRAYTDEMGVPEGVSPGQFINEIKRNPRACQMATNPLLMSLIGLLYLKKAALPAQRGELYRDAIEYLIQRRPWPGQSADISNDSDKILELLGSVAFEMLHQGRGDLITRREVSRLLERRAPELRSGQIMLRLDQGVGLLSVRGTGGGSKQNDLFAFSHQTFQDYLAGCELGRRFVDSDLDLKVYLRLSRWHEPLLFAAAYLAYEYPFDNIFDRFIGQIFAAEDRYERLCHHNLMFSIRFLNEVELSEKRVDYLFRRLDQVLDSPYRPLYEMIKERLQPLRGTELGKRICRLLMKKLDHAENRVRIRAIEMMTEWLVNEPGYRCEFLSAYVARLLHWLVVSSTDDAIQKEAARAVGEVGNFLKDPMPNWLSPLVHVIMNVGSTAIEALGKIDDWSSPPWISSWLRGLVREGHSFNYSRTDIVNAITAAVSLERHGIVVDWTGALDDFLRLFVGSIRDEDYYHSRLDEAVQLFDKATSERLFEALISYVNSAHESSNLYRSAIDLLAHFNHPSLQSDMLKALSFAATTSKNIPYFRERAILELGRLGERAGEHEVVEALRECLLKGETDIRYRTCWSLGRIGKAAARPEVIEALYQALQYHEWVKRPAIEALSILGAYLDDGAKVEAFRFLSPFITYEAKDSYTTSSIRFAAAEALVRIGFEPEKSQGLNLLKMALDGKAWEVKKAFQRLGRAANRKDIIEVLIERLGQKIDLELVSALIAIGALDSHREEIIEALSDLLCETGYHWYEVFDLVADMGKDAAQPKIMDQLCRFIEGDDPGRRSAAAGTLVSFGTQAATPRVLDALEDFLTDDKGCDSSDPYLTTKLRSRDQVYTALCRLATFSATS